MEIEVRTFHLNRNSWVQELKNQYVKKIGYFENFVFKAIKNESLWLKAIAPTDHVWVCDERGESLSSHQFSRKIEQLRDNGCRRLVFIVGGPFGLPQEVKERANGTLMLSSFVLNQEVALVVLMEQIFRAYTIIHNHPYHNE